jgi:hypothetical protein
MKNCFLLYFAILISTFTFSQAKDTIVFNNGTVVIGEIIKIKLGVITFDPDDANDITVQLRKLKSISAARTVFRIETTDQKVFYGQLRPNPLTQFATLVTGTDTSTLFIEDITVLYPFKNSFAQRFSGSAGVGFSYTRSSDFGQLNFNGKLNYTSSKDEVITSTSGIYSMTDSSFDRNREDFTLKNNYYWNPKWFATVYVSYQRNIELGLTRRYSEGLGVGNKYITSKSVYSWARTGLVLNQEKSTENVQTGTLAEIFGQIQFNFFRFTKPEINFIFSQSFYYGISQSGRFRNDGETNLSWELIKDFNLNFTFYNNYDSRPPIEGARQFDFGIVFGFNYSF